MNTVHKNGIQKSRRKSSLLLALVIMASAIAPVECARPKRRDTQQSVGILATIKRKMIETKQALWNKRELFGACTAACFIIYSIVKTLSNPATGETSPAGSPPSVQQPRVVRPRNYPAARAVNARPALSLEQARRHEAALLAHTLRERHHAERQSAARQTERATLRTNRVQPVHAAPGLQPRRPLARQRLLAHALIPVNRQQYGDCGLHAIANAASVNECINRSQPVEARRIQGYNRRFYNQGAQELGFINALSNRNIMALAKGTFGMNNCCLINRTTTTCHTTSQSEYDLNRGIVHNGGPASNNASIHNMIDQLKRSDSGAVHFISGINGNHWILVSLIKERRNNQCSIGYMDSNNTPLENQPDALNCINFIRDNYGNHLLS